jgi:Sec-independent protein translocase protein TatA
MFGIGWAEMLVIAVAVVVLVRPDQAPEVARTVGRTYRQLRRLIADSSAALEKEVNQIKEALAEEKPAVRAEEKLVISAKEEPAAPAGEKPPVLPAGRDDSGTGPENGGR